MDARKLEFPDNSFYMVVLDPPHLINCGKTSDMAKSYGVLEKAWHEDMKRIFKEAWRVLKPNGTLIFKWADKDVSLAEYWNVSLCSGTKSLLQIKPEQTVSF